jgi:peptide deformylase
MPLQIAQLGQPVLRRPAAPIDPDAIGSPALEQLVDAMWETLRDSGGVGLAAPQVFASQRLFLAAVQEGEGEGEAADPEQPPGVEVFINPHIVAVSVEKAAAWEGCLSFQELLVMVERPLAVRIEYCNRQGKSCTMELEGFSARVVQHECDHLDGILTLDRAVSTRYIIKASELDAIKDADKAKE